MIASNLSKLIVPVVRAGHVIIEPGVGVIISKLATSLELPRVFAVAIPRGPADFLTPFGLGG